MNKGQESLTNLNREFYNEVATGFSRSRRQPWQGWKKLMPYFHKFTEAVTITDIGCGDGRYLGFLLQNKIECHYIGIDTSSELLKIATQSYPQTKFILGDATIVNLPTNNDVVCLFGVTHHLSGVEHINIFFNKICKTIKPKGYLIFTIWKFDPSRERLFNNRSRELGVNLKENDYLLDWGGTGENLRFCHLYTDAEIDLVNKNLIQNKFSLVEKFQADKQNEYYVFIRN